MELTIRHYHETDADRIIELFDEFLTYIYAIDPLKHIHRITGDAQETLVATIKEVGEQNGVFYVAEKDGQLIGFIAGMIFNHKDEKTGEQFDPEGRVTQFYLKEAFRGQGIGSSLLGRVEEYFKDNGCELCWIMVFRPNNIAYEFYHQKGYHDRNVDLMKRLGTDA